MVRGIRGTFAGLAASGLPLSGVIVTEDDMFSLVTHPVPHAKTTDDAAASTEAAFDDAIRGAAAARDEYRSRGNAASAGYYETLRRRIESGRPE